VVVTCDPRRGRHVHWNDYTSNIVKHVWPHAHSGPQSQYAYKCNLSHISATHLHSAKQTSEFRCCNCINTDGAKLMWQHYDHMWSHMLYDMWLNMLLVWKHFSRCIIVVLQCWSARWRQLRHWHIHTSCRPALSWHYHCTLVSQSTVHSRVSTVKFHTH